MTHVYRDPADLARHNAGTRAWDRVVQALADVSPQDAPHTRSLGDSLTYWVTDAERLARPTYTAALLYQTLLYPLTDDLHLSLAPRAALAVVEPYRDLDDVESLTGDGSWLTVPAGAVALVGRDEAWRVAPGPGRVAVLRLTVEAPDPRPVSTGPLTDAVPPTTVPPTTVPPVPAPPGGAP